MPSIFAVLARSDPHWMAISSELLPATLCPAGVSYRLASPSRRYTSPESEVLSSLDRLFGLHEAMPD